MLVPRCEAVWIEHSALNPPPRVVGAKFEAAFITEDEILSVCSLLHPEITYADIDALGAKQTTDYLMTKFA